MRQLLFLIVFFLLYSPDSYSNIDDFQGKIKILKESAYDTVWVEVFIKDDYIRVDEYRKDNKLLRSYISNVKSGNTYLVSYQSKMYSLIRVNTNTSGESVSIIKSDNFIVINGQKCYQWRVKDDARQTVTTYWVALTEYNFIPKLCRALANADSAIDEYVKVPQSINVIPLKVVDRTRFRKFRSCIRVIDISPMKISESMFKIPKNFRELISS